MTITAVVTILSGVIALALFVVLVLKFGPKRGDWNQPAAKLRAPGRRLRIALYVVAGLHVVAGVVAAFAAPGGGVGVVLVGVAAGGFYVLLAEVMRVASLATRVRDQLPHRPGPSAGAAAKPAP
jgi:hypothetical protein